MSQILRINDEKDIDIFVVVSSSYIYLIQNGIDTYRINSQQSILTITKVSQTSFVVINSLYHWACYRVTQNKSQCQFQLIQQGDIIRQNESVEQLISVQIYKQAILFFIMSNGNIYTSKINSNQINREHSKVSLLLEQLPITYEHHKYLAKQYLPDLHNSQKCLVMAKIINSTIYYVFQISNYSESKGSNYAIYCCEIDPNTYGLRSGFQSILYCLQKPLTILSINQTIIIQTQQNLFTIKGMSQLKEQKLTEKVIFTQKLIKHKNLLYGVGQINNKRQIFTLKYALQWEVRLQKSIDSIQNILTVFPSKQLNTYYVQTQKHQFSKLNFQKNKPTLKVIIDNHQSCISSASLHQRNLSNTVLFTKTIGQNTQSFLITSQNVVVSVNRYQHSLNLESANLILKDGSSIWFSSQILGTMQLNFELIKTKPEQSILKINQSKKPIASQTLYLSDDIQITQSMISSTKYKQVEIVKLFQGSCSTISIATYLSKSNTIVLGIGDQAHFFQVPSYKRLMIHCFQQQIANILEINDVNIVAVSYHSSYIVDFMLIDYQNNKITKLSSIQPTIQIFSNYIPLYSEFNRNTQANIDINTTSYKITILGDKIILCSNQEMYRYQPDKIKLELFTLPTQKKYNNNIKILPIWQLSDNQTSTPCHRFMIISFEQWIMLTINKKNLIKNFQDMLIQVENVLGLESVFENIYDMSQFYLQQFVALFIDREDLIILSGNRITTCKLKAGKHSLKNPFCKKLFAASTQNSIKNLADLQFQYPIKQIIKISKDKVLVHTEFELWYAIANEKNSKQNELILKPLSFFGCPNEDFRVFRNNLSVNQLNDPQVMKLFSSKMKIVQVKYLAQKQLIILLMEHLIFILKVGHNHALIVQQQVLFESSAIRIIQLLDLAGQDSIYMKDNQSRLLILKPIIDVQQQHKRYGIELIQQLEDDVKCVARVDHWGFRSRSYRIGSIQKQKKYNRIIVKKDGTMIIQDEKGDKTIYL